MAVLYTIGYEGRDIEQFIAMLKEAGVTHVADVRERLASRKRGFSKTSLGNALAASGLGYSTWRELGTPPAVRQHYHADHDTAKLYHDYRESLAGKGDKLDELARLAETEAVALMCYEADHNLCHRTVTAEALCQHGDFEVRHL